MNNDYVKNIEQAIPSTFDNIYIIDIMADLVMEYKFENNTFNCINTIPFTTFYSNLENTIHPEDLKGYVDNISSNNLQENLNKGIKSIRFEYRKKMEDGHYDWHTNIARLIEVNQKKLALVLVENINENIEVKDGNAPTLESVQKQQKIVFDKVSNAIIKLNGVVNINSASSNPEVKSLSDYINDILVDLTNSFPELSKSLTDNMISSTSQGTTKTILVVDDDNMTCKLLAKTFEDTYNIITANNGQEAIDILEKNIDVTNFDGKDQIVGMFLDLNMPVVDGFGVLDYMSSKNLLSKMPVIIISGDYDQETKDKAYLYPIADVLEKPFNVQVVKHRIKTLVKLYKTNNSLNEIVLTQHQDIKNVLKTIVKSYLYDCCYDIKRISSYVNILAKQMNEDYTEYNFDQNKIEKLTEASKYYNIGMFTLPRKLLQKQNFTANEIKIIKSHPFVGLSIFESVIYHTTDRIFNQYAREIIEYHEERYDGTGYPHAYVSDKTPISAQIVSVAIEYNELLKTMNESSIIDEISKYSGTKFNPKIVDSLKRCIDQIKKVNER